MLEDIQKDFKNIDVMVNDMIKQTTRVYDQLANDLDEEYGPSIHSDKIREMSEQIRESFGK